MADPVAFSIMNKEGKITREVSVEELEVVGDAIRRLVEKNSNYDADTINNCMKYEEILELLVIEEMIAW